MFDITQKPYFGHDTIVNRLLEPIRQYADLTLMGFGRIFTNQERFFIGLIIFIQTEI